MKILHASPEDMAGIFALHKTCHIDYIRPEDRPDGFVTTNLTWDQLERLISVERGVIIAKNQGQILGYALAAPWKFWSEWPFFAHMIQELPKFQYQGNEITTENSYQYGPICVHRSVRGTGVFEELFYSSLASMKERYPIMATFINQINPRSYAAHTRKAGMDEVGTFSFNQNQYYLMACFTDCQQA